MPPSNKSIPGKLTGEALVCQLASLISSQEFTSIDEARTFLQQTLKAGGGMQPAARGASPQERADKLMSQAWEARGKKRAALARQALKLNPDCSEAYLVLSQECVGTEAEAFGLVQQALAAGERTLGAAAFQEDIGHFWGILETRPYMRARSALAQMLWMRGEHVEATQHLQEMLRLNPNDNQGVRYVLLNWLLELGQNDAAEALLNQFQGDSGGEWAWGKTLLDFRREGNTSATQQSLQAALKVNPHVPNFLLGEKKMPDELPQYIGMGDEREAISVVYGQAGAWYTTPGAHEWLKQATAELGSRTLTRKG